MRTPTCQPAARRPGRPRSEQAEHAIIEATLGLLAEGSSVVELSVEAVAARAGVGKATIYRRWPNKEALVADAVRTLHAPLPQDLPSDSVRESLITLLDAMCRRADSTLAGRILPNMIAEAHRNPELAARYHAQVIEPRFEQVRAVLRNGVTAGQIRPDADIEMAVHCLFAPLVMFTKLNPSSPPVSRDLVARLVDFVLGAAGGTT